MAIVHSKVSAIADGGNSSLVQPSDWNDDHDVTTSTVTPATGDKILIKDVSDSENLKDVLVSALIDDTAYDEATWNGSTVAPTKNAVRDKIEAIVAGAASISDTAYGAGWDGDTTNGASKNALYDKIETLQPLDADLTTIAGLTATTDNFLQAKSSAWASRTVAQVSVDLQATGLVTDAVGFRTIPQNSQSVDYTLVAADSGKHIYETGASKTVTIPANASVAYPIGTTITFIATDAGGCSIAITSDTLRWAEDGTTGTRTLAQYGVATTIKVTSTEWLISGVGLS